MRATAGMSPAVQVRISLMGEALRQIFSQPVTRNRRRMVGHHCLTLIPTKSDASYFTCDCTPFSPAMPQAAPALLDTRLDEDAEVHTHADRTAAGPASFARSDILLSIHEEIAPIEPDWRAFERRADGTVFQTCEWL